MAHKFGDFARENTVTTGTGALTLTAVTGFARISDIFPVGTLISYGIKNGDNREIGRGTVGVSEALARTSVESTRVNGVSNITTPTAINLVGSSEVYVVVTATDLQAFEDHINSASNPHATSINNLADTTISTVTKGDLLARSGSKWVNVGVGSDGDLLTADAAEVTGVKWAASAGGSPFTTLKFSLELAKTTATLNGSAITNHVNLSNGGVTGAAGQAYDFCTVLGGQDSQATNRYTTVCGGINGQAKNQYSFCGGGVNALCRGDYAVALGGRITTADGDKSTAIGGEKTVSAGLYSTTLGGKGGRASHTGSIAGGGGSLTRADWDFVLGATDTTTPSTTNNTIRIEVSAGNIKADGAFSSPESDTATMIEWADGNPSNEDRNGLFVSVVKGKIVIGGGNIKGLISTTPTIIGNNAPNRWQGTFLRDNFKRILKGKYDLIYWYDKFGDKTYGYRDLTGVVFEEYPQPTNKSGTPHKEDPIGNITVVNNVLLPIVNPAFDIEKDIDYKPRNERPEWGVVGRDGQIICRTVERITSDFVDVDTLTGMAKNGTTYDVMEVISDDLIKVLVSFKS